MSKHDKKKPLYRKENRTAWLMKSHRGGDFSDERNTKAPADELRIRLVR